MLNYTISETIMRLTLSNTIIIEQEDDSDLTMKVAYACGSIGLLVMIIVIIEINIRCYRRNKEMKDLYSPVLDRCGDYTAFAKQTPPYTFPRHSFLKKERLKMTRHTDKKASDV